KADDRRSYDMLARRGGELKPAVGIGGRKLRLAIKRHAHTAQWAIGSGVEHRTGERDGLGKHRTTEQREGQKRRCCAHDALSFRRSRAEPRSTRDASGGWDGLRVGCDELQKTLAPCHFAVTSCGRLASVAWRADDPANATGPLISPGRATAPASSRRSARESTTRRLVGARQRPRIDTGTEQPEDIAARVAETDCVPAARAPRCRFRECARRGSAAIALPRIGRVPRTTSASRRAVDAAPPRAAGGADRPP